MGEIVLRTERLDLRVPGDDGAALKLRHLNSAAAMAHLGGPMTLEQIAERLARTRACFAAEGFCFLFAFERETGELVAHCGLKRVDNPLAQNVGDLEVGWLVREDRWRRGYAREAASAVLAWAFEDHAAPHVVALTSGRNTASWGLMERLGMTRAPELDFDDPDYPPEDNPTILYRIDRRAWEQAG
jgi:RimJ/RimL family protein N-acetyltransferase